jgi:predicted DNA-binding transcriptional regulator AlpA
MSELQQTSPLTPSAPTFQSQDTHIALPLLDGYLRREELAKQFGLSPRTIDRWEALRIGPPRTSVGRTILYSVQSVREWLLSREKQAVPVKGHRRLRVQ